MREVNTIARAWELVAALADEVEAAIPSPEDLAKPATIRTIAQDDALLRVATAVKAWAESRRARESFTLADLVAAIRREAVAAVAFAAAWPEDARRDGQRRGFLRGLSLAAAAFGLDPFAAPAIEEDGRQGWRPCWGLRRDGHPCQGPALRRSRYCAAHQGQEAAAELAALSLDAGELDAAEAEAVALDPAEAEAAFFREAERMRKVGPPSDVGRLEGKQGEGRTDAIEG